MNRIGLGDEKGLDLESKRIGLGYEKNWVERRKRMKREIRK